MRNLELNIINIFLLLILGFSSACTTTPTGRSQLNLVSDAEMNSMGKKAFSEIKKKTPIENNPMINKYVQCISDHLLSVSRDQTGVSDWTVIVFKAESANAFALPGGSIGVNTGMLKVAKTQGQLAAVIGHEIAHVIARHGAERMSQALVTQGGLILADQALEDSGNRDLIMATIGLGAQFGVALPFSRRHESEADEMGLLLMARAGFNPSEAVQLWKQMAKLSKGSAPEFMSTHPSNSTRINRLQQEMPAAIRVYNNALRKGIFPKCSKVIN